MSAQTPQWRPMTLEEARALVKAEDTSDRGLLAMAAVLRFHGIEDPRLIEVAKLIESAAGSNT
jgi:hypothetical protein